MRAIIPCILLASLAAHALPARAQEEEFDDYTTVERVLTGAAPVAESQLRAKCMELGTEWMRSFDRTGRPRAHVTCRMTETEELRRVGDVRYRLVRYRRQWVLPPDDPRRPADRRRYDEEAVVLFSQSAAGGRLHPQWSTSYGPSFTAAVHLETAPTADGGTLLSVLECVNGTGGCRQHFILRRARRWRPVREPWFRQLPASMHDRFHKGTFIDPATLRGRGGLYADRDGNCCPSREVVFRVALRGDSLVLRDHRVRPNERQ